MCEETWFMKWMATVPPCEADKQLPLHSVSLKLKIFNGFTFVFSFILEEADLCGSASYYHHTLVTSAMLKGIKWSGKISTDTMAEENGLCELGLF